MIYVALNAPLPPVILPEDCPIFSSFIASCFMNPSNFEVSSIARLFYRYINFTHINVLDILSGR